MDLVWHDPRFALSASGRFYEREGPLGRAARSSEQKLCVVATDARLLAELLFVLSLREDCVFVKYGAIAREGMVLGRCFLQTDEAAGELCQALKAHPRLMVSLQDDAFLAAYRESPPTAGAIGVYDEWKEHAHRMAEIVREAFGRTAEAELVERVRAAGHATISLVAEIDRRLVGHVLLSPITLKPDASGTAPLGLGLGPLAVQPDSQRRGVGSELVRVALMRARLLGYGFVVVLGDPAFYGRFGFAPAERAGLRAPGREYGDAFMALALRPGALQGVSAEAHYVPEFG